MEDKRTLLQSLKDLYTKVFIASLHNRLHQYHPSVDSDQHQQLNLSLHHFIDQTDLSVSQPDNKKKPDADQTSEETPIKPLNDRPADSKTGIASLTLNALSLYFKKNKALEKDPAIADRLQRCVVDHTHTAQRLARSGNQVSAKIHADIASDALKTLSHYMVAEEYNDFFKQVNQNIDEKKSSA
ncbi:MAG: hypothetical protein OEY36_03595 [Gammaproteobacteria bacterium]|nr:hypothetical protein [Gammaproteobacteria bacterium]